MFKNNLILAIDWRGILTTVINWCTTTGIKVVIGLFLLWLSFKIVNFIFKKIDQNLDKRHVEKTVKSVTISVLRKVIKFLLLICFIGYLGIETSSITAAIASAALTVGLALQGALSNLAGGVLIILLKPFKIGDFIETNGQSGTVTKIDLLQTYMKTGDNRVVILPNGKVSDGVVVNYSMNRTRRLDMIFSIAYENDFRKAKRIIKNEIEKTGLALGDPAPFVNIKAHNASSIDIVVRVWVNSEDYWDLNWILLESIKLAFDKNAISIPYSQIDVHMKKDENILPEQEEDAFVKAEIDEYHEVRAKKKIDREQKLKAMEEEQQKEQKSLLKKFSKATKVED